MSLGDNNVSRREACTLLGGVAASAALGSLSGCGGAGVGSDTMTGFASDTEVKSYPLTVYIVADSDLKRGFAGSDTGRVEDYFSRYQAQTGREQVTFAIKYASTEELQTYASLGYPEGDAVIALQSIIEAAAAQGTLYGGAANTSIRNFTSQLMENCTVFKPVGSKVKMPKADTIDGEDSEDGQISRMQNLPSLKGKIAIANSQLLEGMLANRVLARWGFYSEESGKGGTYSSELIDKVSVYDDLEAMVAAVVNGDCSVGFGVQSMLWGDFPGIEELYQPAFGVLVYSGASTPDTASGGVARDFFEYIIHCV